MIHDMKKQLQHFLFIILFLSIPGLAKSQFTNLVFFSEQGERFSVVLNGILQNDKPETNIMVADLPAPSYKIKLLFEDPNIPAIDKTLMFNQGTETTFCIKKNKKGEYVLRYMNEVPIAQKMPPPPERHVIIYTAEPPMSPVPSTTQQTQVTSTSISGMGITATTTTSVQTTTVNNEANIQMEDHSVKGKPIYVMPGYNGPVGCPHPITDLNFNKVKETIASKSLEDSKLTIAKQVTASNCLFASEIKEIMKLFLFETTRLEYAKYAYRYTYDLGNYYLLNDAFTFESSIEELNDFIQGKSN